MADVLLLVIPFLPMLFARPRLRLHQRDRAFVCLASTGVVEDERKDKDGTEHWSGLGTECQ